MLQEFIVMALRILYGGGGEVVAIWTSLAHEKQSNNISTAIYTSLPIITHVSTYTQIFKHLEKGFATHKVIL
jgi:hypothetical protein